MAEQQYNPNQSLYSSGYPPYQESQPLMAGAPPPFPSRSNAPGASAPPPLPSRGAPTAAPGGYPSSAFISPHQAHVSSPPMQQQPPMTVGAQYAVYPSAASAAPATQVAPAPVHTNPSAPPMMQSPALVYAPNPQQQQQQPQPMYSQQPPPQPVYSTQTAPIAQNPYATQPGPMLMTRPPTYTTAPPTTATQNNSLFVASGESAKGLATNQPPQMQGPHVSVHVISATFNKSEWAPWVRIRIGSDQSGWSNYGQSKVKGQKETQGVEWNEMFHMPVKFIGRDRIQIEVVNQPTQFQLDYSVIGSNDILVERLPNEQPQHLVMPLTDRRGTTRGQLTIVVTGHQLVRPTVVQAAADPLKTFIKSIFK